MKALIYMPALNEEEGIKDVLDSLPKKLSGISSIQYLVVDDFSSDNTAQIAKDWGAIVISHKSSKRVGGAFQTALKYALENKIDLLVSTDADRQFNIEQIPELISPVLNGKADMVTGNRFVNGMPDNMSKTKFWGNKQMSNLISLISGQKFQDVSCGFRVYGREALLNLNLTGGFTYTQETILDMINKGFKVLEMPVDVVYFKSRKSRIANSILEYAFKTSSIIITTLRDNKPMVFFGGLGILSGLIGLLSGIIPLINFINYKFTRINMVFAIISASFISFTGMLFIAGLLANMFIRIRTNQERILYQMKKDRYDK